MFPPMFPKLYSLFKILHQYPISHSRFYTNIPPKSDFLSLTLGKAIGLMEAMIRWFGKRDMFYVMTDLRSRKPICCEGDINEAGEIGDVHKIIS